MAYYRISDLMELLNAAYAANSGYAEISESEPDSPDASLTFSYIDGGETTTDYVDSLDIKGFVPHTCHFESTDIAPISFTFSELCLMQDAIYNNLEYAKVESAKDSCTRQERDTLKSYSIALRNLQAKLNRLLGAPSYK